MNKLIERLQRGYEYIVYPTQVPLADGSTVNMADIPVELEKMAKYDALGNITGYYSISELSQAVGNVFVSVPYISDNFALIHWAFDKGLNANGVSDETATIDLLKSKGLVDMRENIPLAKDIDYPNLPPNAFGIFGSYEIVDVPKAVPI